MYIIAIELLNYNASKNLVALNKDSITKLYSTTIENNEQIIAETFDNNKYVLQDHIELNLLAALKAITK